MNVCILRALSQGTMSDDEEYEFQYSDDEGGGGGEETPLALSKR